MEEQRASRRRTVRGRARHDEGAALVEFAVISPLFFLLIFGIIEFGMAFNDYQSIRQGAREGARQAVVGEYLSTGTSCGLNGGAASAATNAQKLICLVKQRSDVGNSLRVSIQLTDNSPSGDNRGDPFKVCAVKPVETITGFLDPFIEGKPLRTEIQMRGEKRDLGLAAGTYQETDPTGQNWSWC
jgi:Flp pilus assembly protein TadG